MSEAEPAKTSESLFAVGDEVFAVVTPYTNYLYMEWRNPFPYFLLKGVVRTPWVFRHGPELVELQTGYEPFRKDRVFSEEHEARRKLVQIFESETHGTLDPAKVRIFEASGERALIESRLRAPPRIVHAL